MMNYKNVNKFIFNSFGVNTYILADANTGKCLVIDPACQYKGEETELLGFLTENHLLPVAMINTHYHIDHILGNTMICTKYNLSPQCHKSSKLLWETATDFGRVFGINVEDLIIPVDFIDEGDSIPFGESTVKVLYTPGHADGSICLVNHAERYVITGDVLFRDSIGRTDLPTGNFDTLYQSITTKLFTLPDDYVVYPGHGPETTIGYEKLNNPFL
jgi:glyoxylase-like metal-dependent hydrolase (beta-lactamase superfamily II)